ncbi:CRISPR-associated protein Csn2 [Aedoeadaptatus coxii]|uniref:type II-A CRISPR-associated protein Csn2 n=1 Tax=Aedoeadaptatus coxii TaxID=755172 RepID=UPI0017746C0C|nr:type II-A CRISPR-associated protein Csn2 [Peptoniphilus coxii]CAC9932663.1 CRISPR-associated protein Csn2 [Peptoniphilus coxii]
MMIYLNFHMLDTPLTLHHMSILSVEDTALFATLVENLYSYEENGAIKIFQENQEQLKTQQIIVITDILNYDLNNSSLLKRIDQEVIEALNEKPECKTEIEALLIQLNKIMREEMVDHELDIEVDDLTIEKLLKELKPRVKRENFLFNKMTEILDVHRYLNKKGLLIFINTLAYFTDSQRQNLCEYIFLNNMNVLFLEPHKIENMEQYYLDKDYFLLKV